MKKIITIVLLTFTITLSAQQIDYNTDDGYIAEGYDITEYFNNKAVEGKVVMSLLMTMSHLNSQVR